MRRITRECTGINAPRCSLPRPQGISLLKLERINTGVARPADRKNGTNGTDYLCYIFSIIARVASRRVARNIRVSVRRNCEAEHVDRAVLLIRGTERIANNANFYRDEIVELFRATSPAPFFPS